MTGTFVRIDAKNFEYRASRQHPARSGDCPGNFRVGQVFQKFARAGQGTRMASEHYRLGMQRPQPSERGVVNINPGFPGQGPGK